LSKEGDKEENLPFCYRWDLPYVLGFKDSGKYNCVTKTFAVCIQLSKTVNWHTSCAEVMVDPNSDHRREGTDMMNDGLPPIRSMLIIFVMFPGGSLSRSFDY